MGEEGPQKMRIFLARSAFWGLPREFAAAVED
jgi:hypothetical protein